MQLVSNDRRTEDSSETEPILHQSNIVQRSEESSSSFEIRTVSRDCSLSADDSQTIDVDENCNLGNADQPQCRICLDIGGEDLIAPFHCKGTQKYVHSKDQNFLLFPTKRPKRFRFPSLRSETSMEFRNSIVSNEIRLFLCVSYETTNVSIETKTYVEMFPSKTNYEEGFAFAHCTECRAVFVLRANVPSDRWWLRLKFQFLVARDHAFIFVIVQLIVAFLGVLVYKFYGEELREMFGYEEHPYGFYTMAVLAIVLVGLLYGFFIAIICGQRINERHYHVLAKQELTKEYVVQDRDANKDVPELDPSHVTELRMLGLF